MTFKTHVTAPQIDRDVVLELETLNCNIAMAYCIYTRVFDQDVNYTEFHKYLRLHYPGWCPCYKVLCEKWMPTISRAQSDVRERKKNRIVTESRFEISPGYI